MSAPLEADLNITSFHLAWIRIIYFVEKEFRSRNNKTLHYQSRRRAQKYYDKHPPKSFTQSCCQRCCIQQRAVHQFKVARLNGFEKQDLRWYRWQHTITFIRIRINKLCKKQKNLPTKAIQPGIIKCISIIISGWMHFSFILFDTRNLLSLCEEERSINSIYSSSNRNFISDVVIRKIY